MKIDIQTIGLDHFALRFKRQPEITQEAAQLAVNDAARFGETLAVRRMMEEVEFTRGYLKDGRFGVTKYASRNKLEAVLSGRDRGTSLARFAKTAVRYGRQAGVSIKVSAYKGAKKHDNAFFMRLNRGRSFNAENANTGLAVRVKEGTKLRQSRGAVDLGGGVYLLYGPSVNQVFKGVAADVVDDIGDKAQKEFDRQYLRLSK